MWGQGYVKLTSTTCAVAGMRTYIADFLNIDTTQNHLSKLVAYSIEELNLVGLSPHRPTRVRMCSANRNCR